MLEYNDVKKFDKSKIRNISDIQFFNRIIDNNKFPSVMVEYSYQYGRIERELYQFDTEEDRTKFYTKILNKVK